MYEKLLHAIGHTPEPYESTGIVFWDDEHISKSMLAAHLRPDADGASRTHAFIESSAAWIAGQVGRGKSLLDLGCGPGLYAERFYDAGFRATGVDLSRRSIAYAKERAQKTGRDIDYQQMDYMNLDFDGAFDLAVLIYCDYGVLPPGMRQKLLKKVFRALKPGGLLVLDAFATPHYQNFVDRLATTYEENGGFWQEGAYLCIQRDKRYPKGLYLEQYTIVAEDGCQTYNLWNHAFGQKELADELGEGGFSAVGFYGDAAGVPLKKESSTICVIARKES